VLYSTVFDSTASQQPASLQLQDIEDTSNDSIFTWMMLYTVGYSFFNIK